MLESILKFRVDGKILGIDSEKALQILRFSSITPVPLTNEAFRGVSVVGGKIVSIIDLGLSFDLGKIDETLDTARLITTALDSDIYAVLVEEVLGITFIKPENYEPSNDDNKKIEGFYKENGEICQIIDIEEILKEMDIAAFSASKVEKLNQDNRDNSYAQDDFSKFLFFRMSSELFAIDIDIINELVFVPEEITPIPESETFVLGMITLRNKIINTLDLTTFFGFNPSKNSNKSRLIIIQDDKKRVALCVDFIEEAKDIEKSQIERVPENFKDNKIDSIYKDENGEIASIISNKILKQLIKDYHLDEEDDKQIEIKGTKESSMIEVVIFSIDTEEFAIDINNVQEIIRYSNATPMPNAPEFVEGVINLRGIVIPIVSLQEKLGFEKNITDTTKILICNIKDSKIGFLVDDVKEILSIEDDSLSSSKGSDTLFDEIITLDNGERVILKLKVDKLFSDDELDNLKMEDNKE